MGVHHDREHFIPVRCADLIDVLCDDRGPDGQSPLTPDQRDQFRHFALLLMNHYHREFHARLQKLKNAYAPFDPDADTVTLRQLSDEERVLERDRLFDEFIDMLQRANYRRMTREEVEKEMLGASYWGIDMSVDWSVFDRIELFHRGAKEGKRFKRHWLLFWRKKELPVPTWQRMVLILKQAPHKRLGEHADLEHVFLKLFKDIPRMDLEMLLPGTRIRMHWTQRGKLGVSALSSVAYVAWKLSQYSLAILKAGFTALYAPLFLIGGYAYKTWAGFTTTRQTYMLQLAQSLYYQNLDNNGGVLYRLLDEAEEQESREAMLAYFYLWRYADARPWSDHELDDFVEEDLQRKLNLPVDFEIGDALDKLDRLHLLVNVGDLRRVRSIETAIAVLDHSRLADDPTVAEPAPPVQPPAEAAAPPQDA